MNDTEYSELILRSGMTNRSAPFRAGHSYPMLGGKHVGGRAIVSSPRIQTRHHLPDKTPHSAAAFPFLAGLLAKACFK